MSCNCRMSAHPEWELHNPEPQLTPIWLHNLRVMNADLKGVLRLCDYDLVCDIVRLYTEYILFTGAKLSVGCLYVLSLNMSRESMSPQMHFITYAVQGARYSMIIVDYPPTSKASRHLNSIYPDHAATIHIYDDLHEQSYSAQSPTILTYLDATIKALSDSFDSSYPLQCRFG